MEQTEPKRGSTVWFLLEQARCLMQASTALTTGIDECIRAASYLAPETTESYIAAIKTAEPKPEWLDYELEDYPQKDRDLAGALYTLSTLGNDASLPEEDRIAMRSSANLIATFYGVDDEINRK